MKDKRETSVSDKSALINFAIHNVNMMRKNETSDTEIENLLKNNFNFSDEMIEQLM